MRAFFLMVVGGLAAGCGLALDLDPRVDASGGASDGAVAVIDGGVPDAGPLPDAGARPDARADGAGDASTVVPTEGGVVFPDDTGASDACVPVAEECNLADDDCNGVADDLPPVQCCGALISACVDGVLVGCAVMPAPETANGVDDDCDGVIDNGYGCSRYVLAGRSGSGATFDDPAGSIQPMINELARAATTGTVCVGAVDPTGNACRAFYPEHVVMAEGVSVLGGLRADTFAGWTRDPACSTQIRAPAPPATVEFPHDLTAMTVLESCVVTAPDGSDTAAIAFAGGGRVLTSTAELGATGRTAGISARGGGAAGIGTVMVDRTTVRASPAGGIPSEAFGIRIEAMTAAIVGGSVNAGPAMASSRGVVLKDAAGSSIVGLTEIVAGRAATSFGLHIEGSSAGIRVDANGRIVAGVATTAAAGIHAERCSSNSPVTISGTTGTIAGAAASRSAVGIDVTDCVLEITSNMAILGRSGGNQGAARGIRCVGRGGSCLIEGNRSITGAMAAAMDARAVELSGGAGGRVATNASITGCAAAGSTGCHGVFVEGAIAEVRIDGNTVREHVVGDGATWITGIFTRASRTFVENNVVYVHDGSGIEVNIDPAASGSGQPEATVHSNTVVYVGAGDRPSNLLVIDTESSAALPSGVLRNNIAACLASGPEVAAYAELGMTARARVLDSNDLHGCSVLYRDRVIARGLTALNAAALGYARNVSVPPLFVAPPGDLHLQRASTLIDAGSTIDVPMLDHDREPRPVGPPDVGADEVQPGG